MSSKNFFMAEPMDNCWDNCWSFPPKRGAPGGNFPVNGGKIPADIKEGILCSGETPMIVRTFGIIGLLCILTLAVLGIYLSGCKEASNSMPASTYFAGSGLGVGTTTLIVGVVKSSTTKELLANIPVSMWTQSGTQVGSGTLTTGEGKFFFSRPQPGLYIFDVATKSTTYTSIQYPIQVFSDFTISPPSPEVLLTPISVSSSSMTNVLSGVVQLNTSKEPLSGIDVRLYLNDTPIGEPTKTTLEGKFFFNKPSPGLYTIHVASGSTTYVYATYYVQILADGTVSPEVPIINIARLPVTSQVVVATATGRVRDAFSGAPLEYVTCTLKGVGSQITDIKGQFSFGSLIPGNYEIEFSKLGFNKLNANFSISSNGTTIPNPLEYLLIYNQESGKGSIAGRYVDEKTRNGVGSLSVRVYMTYYVGKEIITGRDAIRDSNGNITGYTYTKKTVYMWEFPTPYSPFKSTNTETATTAIPDNSGSFKITHLPPTNSNMRYFVFLGSEGTSVQTAPYVSTEDKSLEFGLQPSTWNMFNGVASHSWEQVTVESDKTTYLSNYDRANN